MKKVKRGLLHLALIGALAGSQGCAEPTPDESDPPAEETGEAASAVGNCAPKTPGGTYTYSFQLGGYTRTYNVYVPKGAYNVVPFPLVFNLHGGTGNAAQQEDNSRLRTSADTYKNFLVVEAQGIAGPLPNSRTWNAGNCCGDAKANQVDDMAYLRAVRDQVKTNFCVDPKAIYGMGHSNGGMMLHRAACEDPTLFAAIASNAGGMGQYDFDAAFNPTSTAYFPQGTGGACNGARRPPVLEIHGLADGCYQYYGGAGALSNVMYEPVERTMANWAVRNGCNPSSYTQVYAAGQIGCYQFNGCAAGGDVQLCIVGNGGHTWVGGAGPYISLIQSVCGGVKNNDMSGNDYMLAFFARYRLP